MPNKSAEELRNLVKRCLAAAGATERNADRVAEALVSANLAGVDTHGVWRMALYVNAIKAGEIVPTAWPEIIRETPSTALITGNWTFGHVAAKYAIGLAMEKAMQQNVAVVGLVQSHHIGRLGEYAEMAAAKGMVSMIWASGYSAKAPRAVPYGGREPVLHTNPISMGFPAEDEPPMVLDFATTAKSGSAAERARDRNEQMPLGQLVDRDGNPTTDPNAAFTEGSHLPFGGHKGYAIMLATEALGTLLTGSDAYAEADRGGDNMRHQGVSMIAFKADLFQPLTDFKRHIDELERRMRAVPPATGFTEVLVPGDLENRARTARRHDGIPVPDDIWKLITDTAASLGVEAEIARVK